MELTCFVLAKNEEPNIARCLNALRGAQVRTVVLDSHSTDATGSMARELGARVETYDYTNHADALEHICKVRTRPGDLAMVLDADMVVSPELVAEARGLLQDGGPDVVCAPVRMYWNGEPLRWGSLYPPKPFMFRGGNKYFEACGHGERLHPGTKVAHTRNVLIHNDLKAFVVYLESQYRYSLNLLERAKSGKVTWRDRLRASPIMIFAAPLVSLLLRGGILNGRAGLGYATDRLIAEAIKYRQSLAERQSRTREAQRSITRPELSSDHGLR